MYSNDMQSFGAEPRTYGAFPGSSNGYTTGTGMRPAHRHARGLSYDATPSAASLTHAQPQGYGLKTIPAQSFQAAGAAYSQPAAPTYKTIPAQSFPAAGTAYTLPAAPTYTQTEGLDYSSTAAPTYQANPVYAQLAATPVPTLSPVSLTTAATPALADLPADSYSGISAATFPAPCYSMSAFSEASGDFAVQGYSGDAASNATGMIRTGSLMGLEDLVHDDDQDGGSVSRAPGQVPEGSVAGTDGPSLWNHESVSEAMGPSAATQELLECVSVPPSVGVSLARSFKATVKHPRFESETFDIELAIDPEQVAAERRARVQQVMNEPSDKPEVIPEPPAFRVKPGVSPSEELELLQKETVALSQRLVDLQEQLAVQKGKQTEVAAVQASVDAELARLRRRIPAKYRTPAPLSARQYYVEPADQWDQNTASDRGIPSHAPARKKRGVIGIEMMEDSNVVLVKALVKDGAAEKAGVQAGDMVCTYDGKHIQTIADFRRAVSTGAVGIPVLMQVQRTGTKGTIELKIIPKSK